MYYYSLDKEDDIIINYVINSIIQELCNKKELYFQIKIMKLCDDIDNKVKNQLNSFYKLNLIQKIIGTKFNNFIENHLENIVDKIFFVLHKKYTITVVNNTINFEKNIDIVDY